MPNKTGLNCPIDHFTLSMTIMTAIKVGDDCITAWNDIKIGHKCRYVIFTFSDDFAKVLVEKKADPLKTYDDFLNDLPQHDVRYAVFDFDFKADDGTDRNKLIFIVWAPDTAPVKKKMVIASTKSSVKNAFAGVGVEIQATDDSEIAHSTVLSKVVASIH
jgi:cofilin